MAGLREKTKEVILYLNKNDKYDFSNTHNDLLAVFWGPTGFNILITQATALKIDLIYKISGDSKQYNTLEGKGSIEEAIERSRTPRIACCEVKLDLVNKNSLIVEFYLSATHGATIDQYRVDDQIEDLIWVKLFNLSIELENQLNLPFVPIRHLSDHNQESEDGPINAVFIWNNRFDIVDIILARSYEGVQPTPVRDPLSQARLARRTGTTQPINQLDEKTVRAAWTHEYYEYEVPKSSSYVLKFGKCPIDSKLVPPMLRFFG